MRKLILTLSLLLSFSFACESKYDEVVGVKIGCPISGQMDVIVEQDGNFFLKYPGLFDVGVVLVSERAVESVILSKSYNLNYQNQFVVGDRLAEDLTGIFSSLNSRWGEFSGHKDAKRRLGIAAINIKNGYFDVLERASIETASAKYVGRVDLIVESTLPITGEKERSASIMVAYTSKDLDEGLRELNKEKYSGL